MKVCSDLQGGVLNGLANAGLSNISKALVKVELNLLKSMSRVYRSCQINSYQSSHHIFQSLTLHLPTCPAIGMLQDG